MLMSPENLRSVKTKTGGRRHIVREGKRLDGPPQTWPICVCNYIEIDEDTAQDHDGIDDIDNLCSNCRKRMINNGR